jgi:hypothetical protein
MESLLHYWQTEESKGLADLKGKKCANKKTSIYKNVVKYWF